MALDLLSLEAKRALITGAGTGLGRQMALGLAEAGADLVLCGRRRAKLEEVAAEASAFGVEVTVIPADVTKEEDVQTLRAESGRIDILLNDAGASDKLGAWTETSKGEWERILTLNLYAPFRLCQLFAPAMMERRWGRIINIASVYGSVGCDPSRYPGLNWEAPAYFASKHGVHGITHVLAPRLAPYGVCINSISPGMFIGERNSSMLSSAMIDRLIDGTPMHRLGNSDDLKAAAVFLASPGAQFVTGQNIIVDGGWTVW